MNIDIGNNKITNLGNPGSANVAVSKRCLHKRVQELTADYNLENVSGNINSIKNEIVKLQMDLLSNRKSRLATSLIIKSIITLIYHLSH